MVGAVLVYNDRIIGEGWHHFYGADHAEVNCLNRVAEADKHLIPESTMYVSLEPCAHYGITPPCAVRIVAEKIKKVVIANIDPFAQVSGRGIDILRDNGIEVETNILEQEARWLNRRFFCFHEQKRPYIILKWAQTKDSFIAPSDNTRLQITNANSNQLVHKWRTEEAAIMVGYNTALHDNPQLTARLWKGRPPLRIVIDKEQQLPPSSHLFDNAAATWVINEQRETLHGNVHHIQLSFSKPLLPQLLTRLHDAKILSLIVEGGAQTLRSFIDAGLWDEARIFTGDIFLERGIAAPALTNATPAFTTELGSDTLQVFTNKDSSFSYIQGMEL